MSDLNSRVGALLRDMADAQASVQSKWGYKRAAAAILALEEPLEQLLQPDGTLRKIPNVGPSSTRVIMEVLQSGGSPTVEAAIAARGRTSDATRRRGLRDHFLSRAQVLAALNNRDLEGPTLSAYRGDLQMHSEWSDGRESLRELVAGCLARGYQYCAVTDHSHGLAIAGGMSPEEMARQHREINALNREYQGRFRLLKSIEANIDAAGGLDVTPAERRRLDLVVAAPHSKLRVPDDQTMRMMAAVETPGVHILAHPRGRMYGSRPGITADWGRVFRRAAELGVAIEIDGDPSRQDLDYTLARQAVRAGCLFALDSDAHSSAELAYAETAIAHARLAGVPPDRVINCWELNRLLRWARQKRTPA